MGLRFLLSVVLIPLLTETASAQVITTSDSLTYPFAFRIGIEGGSGGASINTGVVPIAVLWGTSLQYYGNLFSFRSMTSFDGNDQQLPSQRQSEASILYGIATYDSHLLASAAIGLAFINFLQRGNYLYSDSLGNVKYYAENDEHAVGLAYQVCIGYTTLPDRAGDYGFSISLLLGGNQSKLQQNFAIMLEIGISLWP